MRTNWLTLALLLPLASACQPDEPGVIPLHSAFVAFPERLDLGEVALGARREASLRIENRGSLPLRLHAELSGADSEAFGLAHLPSYLEIGAVLTQAVSFAPDRERTFMATLHLYAEDDPDLSIRTTVGGVGVIPDCDDHSPCTGDRFDLEAGRCVHSHLSGSCDDGRRCTEDDRCAQGLCVGVPIVCDDDVACTVDDCDEEVGCTFTPNHASCASPEERCAIGECDPELGCQSTIAQDGTPCGEPSCAALQVCVQGSCRSGPAPDGFPCEDGDPCTDGDSCHAGWCEPGPGAGMQVTVPVELDSAPLVSSYYPWRPVGVLAVGLPSRGGFEVVWADRSTAPINFTSIVRTRFDADGTALEVQQLATALLARAAYSGDDLYLFLYVCSSCSDISADRDGSCPFELRRYSDDGEPYTHGCLATEGREILEIGLHARPSGADIAYVAADLSQGLTPGGLVVRRFNRSLSPGDLFLIQEWETLPTADSELFPRNLQLTSLQGEPVLAYDGVNEVGYHGSCNYCDFHSYGCICDPLADVCAASMQAAQLSSPWFNPATADYVPFQTVGLFTPARGVALVPGEFSTAVSWTEHYLGPQAGFAGAPMMCTMYNQVSLHTFDPHTHEIEWQPLADYAAFQVAALFGAPLADGPGALVLLTDGRIEIHSPELQTARGTLVVPPPVDYYGYEPRAFVPRTSAAPRLFPALATAATAGGFIAVAISGSDHSSGSSSRTDSDSAGHRTEPDPTAEEADPCIENGCGAASPPDDEGCSYEDCGVPQDGDAPLPDRLTFFVVGCDAEIPPVNPSR